ncbi:MAG: DNA-processing protein DprA [Anaerolineae bacterium]|nr:DNA-processing protein DprA [Thermoflexales bacterium]MDW8395459.1 DNA-processing protein DprA [Anaerolineae bacterium]
MSAELPYYLAFARVQGIGAVRLRKLKAHFGDLQSAWSASEFDLAAAGLEPRLIGALVTTRRTVHPEAEVERLYRAGAQAVTWDDADYPRLLREVQDPPPVLFVKGSLSEADQWAVAVVGTRSATVYGRQVTEMLASDLARNNITVVSGLARGIDATAHEAALKAEGRTIAVLGCGVDVVYPPEHARLAARIAEHGALVSDYPLGTPPDARNFPPRNRIISGLSLGVVVVEADEQSGALITAQFAGEQGREVFAVPGNIFNRSSRGTNRLIQQGAKVVLDTQSILEELNLSMIAERVAVSQVAPENDLERLLLSQLSHDPLPLDDLVRAVNLPAESVAAALALMELKGLVRNAGKMSYVLAQ